jgi:hypothetical protein
MAIWAEPILIISLRINLACYGSRATREPPRASSLENELAH